MAEEERGARRPKGTSELYASGHSFGWFCLPRPATARRLSRLASLEIWCASHAPILQSEPAPTTLIAAHCTAHRAAPRTTRQAAPRCATHHPCALAIVGPGPPGAAAHKRTPGAHPFSRAVFVGARACRPFCTAHRAAPRATRHAAPRCATLRHARCRCHNPRWRLSERPGQAPRVSLGIR